MPDIVRLNTELKRIEKEKNILKLIALQYTNEIARRNKKEQRDKQMRESGEQIIDSPLRRAREDASAIANSPSPVKRLKNNLGLSMDFDSSPERCSRSPTRYSPTKYSPEKISPVKTNKDDGD